MWMGREGRRLVQAVDCGLLSIRIHAVSYSIHPVVNYPATGKTHSIHSLRLAALMLRSSRDFSTHGSLAAPLSSR